MRNPSQRSAWSDGTTINGGVSISSQAGYRLAWVSLLATGVGLIAGLIAFLLYKLIGLFTNLAFYQVWSFHFRSPQINQLGPWVIIVPVLGGLLIGLMVKYGSENIEGHGIPEAMEAVLTSRSRIEAKVAVLKPLSAVIAIDTGGPFGAEEPIIQTGGAFVSLVGQIFSTTATERKVLLACGAGAGMAATFNALIAGVILAIEVLLFEFRARSFIPKSVASIWNIAPRPSSIKRTLVTSVVCNDQRDPTSTAILPGAWRSLWRRSNRCDEAPLLGRRPIRSSALEDRQVSTTDAMARIEALIHGKLEAEKARKQSGLDPDTFEIFWFLQQEQLADAMMLAKEISAVYLRFPNFSSNADEQRQLKAEIYKSLLRVVNGNRALCWNARVLWYVDYLRVHWSQFIAEMREWQQLSMEIKMELSYSNAPAA